MKSYDLKYQLKTFINNRGILILGLIDPKSYKNLS